MRLFHHPNSTFSWRIRIALVEKRLEVELVALDFAGGEHKAPAYLALNPYGRIPTLIDGGVTLYESTAILDYLEAQYPTPPLVPADARGRGLCTMHSKLCDLEIGVHGRALIFPSRFVPRDKWNAAEMAAAREQITHHLEILDGQLGEPWLLGEQYSLADIHYTPFARFWGVLGITPPSRVAAWTERLLARPSAFASAPTR